MLWVMECAEIKTPGELVVLYALADRADDDGRGAFPSQEWLARRSRCSTRSVRRRLGELESRGVICRGDQDLVAHYRPDRRPIVWDICMADGPVLTGGQIDRPDKSGRPTGQIGSTDRTNRVERPDTGVLQTVHNHPEPSSNHNAHFDAFWVTYPRKVGKRKAADAFTKACKRAPVEEVLAGARRFAADPNLPEKRFIPHPTTWLNQDRWDDEPLPAPETPPESPTSDQQPRRGTRASDWLDRPSETPNKPDYAKGHIVLEETP